MCRGWNSGQKWPQHCTWTGTADSTWKEWLNLRKTPSAAEGRRPPPSPDEPARATTASPAQLWLQVQNRLNFKKFMLRFFKMVIHGMYHVFPHSQRVFSSTPSIYPFFIEEMAPVISCQSLLQHQLLPTRESPCSTTTIFRVRVKVFFSQSVLAPTIPDYTY